MVNVSIVLPVYNVEKYLQKCLDSILSQTLKEIEIICVDDGSTDNSPLIIDEYSKKDTRIIAVHKKNEGCGKSNNIGVELAKGEYIAFLESDDWIMPDMIERAYNAATSNDADYVKMDFYSVWEMFEHRKYVNVINNSNYNYIISGADVDILSWDNNAHWSGIYKKSFLIDNNIKYNESQGAAFQDQGFWVQTSLQFKRALYLNIPGYCHREDNFSSSINSSKNMLAMKYEYDFIDRILKEKKLEYASDYCDYLRFRMYMWNYSRISDILKSEFANVIKNDFLKKENNIKFGFNLNQEDFYFLLKSISNDPVQFCETFLRNKKALLEKISKYDNIIVYGAGRMAEVLFEKIIRAGIYDKVKYVAVSENNADGIFFKKEIVTISDLTDYKDALVIVAVSDNSNAYNQIVGNLDKRGFCNYISSKLFIDYLY